MQRLSPGFQNGSNLAYCNNPINPMTLLPKHASSRVKGGKTLLTQIRTSKLSSCAEFTKDANLGKNPELVKSEAEVGPRSPLTLTSTY